MALYSDELLEEIRTKNDIVEVVSQYVPLQKKGGTHMGLCPFHNEKSPSFAVSGSKQIFHCFGCGAGGNVFTFLMKYENFTFGEAVGVLASRAGVALPEKEMTAEQKQASDRRQRLFEVNREAAKYFYVLLRNERGQRAMDYFLNRGLTADMMKKFGLGYSDQYSDDLYRYLRKMGYEDALLKDSGLVKLDEKRGGCDKFWNRAMFPIMDVHSKVIAFGGRVMGEGKPKYLNSPETPIFDKSRNLYGLNFARSTKRSYFLLCEGYMDVIALHQAGFDNAVASLGTSLTDGHAGLIKRYTKEVYLTYDSDGAGRQASLRAIPILKGVGITVKVIDMSPYKDPDEFIKALGAKAYEERIDSAENSFLFEIRMMEEGIDFSDPEQKTKFYHEAAKKLCSIGEKIERDVYIASVAEKYRIPLEDLKKLVGRYGMQLAGGRQAGQGVPRSGVSGENRERHGLKKEDGIKRSQKLLITWLVENPRLYPVIKKYISPDDFTEEIYHEAAARLFRQLDEAGVPNPAQIITGFEDEETQKELAALFNENVRQVETKEEKEKALKETIIKIKKNSMEQRSKQLPQSDMEGMMALIADKKRLEELEKLHISLE